MPYPDNPAPNNIDQIFVSQTQSWEVSYFIDQYIRTRRFPDNPKNRETIRKQINEYGDKHKGNIIREALETHLDGLNKE